MAGTNDTPLLTLGQVQRWESRKVELEQQIKAAQEELTGIARNLEAASVFVRMKNGHDKGAPKTQEEAPEDGSTSEGLADAIVRVAALDAAGNRPAALKKALIKSGFDMTRFDANPGYFYTVLGRLVQRGKLEKRRNGLYRVAAHNSSSQEEAGVVGTPAQN